MKAKLLAAFAAAVSYVRKLPVAQYLKPIWKGALNEIVVQGGGDKLQAELDDLLAKHAPEGLEAAMVKINAAVDGLQARFSGLVAKVPCVPAAARAEVLSEVNRAVDGLQSRLNGAAEAGRAGGLAAAQLALDAAFDRFQVELKARISAL